MSRFTKWMGVGVGFAFGGPLGGLLGYLSASQLGSSKRERISADELTAHLMVLAAYLMNVDKQVTMVRLRYIEDFVRNYFPESDLVETNKMLHHCLSKEYDLNIVCDQLRIYTDLSTRKQVVAFLLDLSSCSSARTQREEYFIFKIAGYLNVNDVAFKHLKQPHQSNEQSDYHILGLKNTATASEIRQAYRQLVLELHPDRNVELSEKDLKLKTERLHLVRGAYERLKHVHGIQ